MDTSASSARHPDATSREVLRLAVPAFLTLVAEPAFLLADTAIVGHLGTVQLAGLGVASAALATCAGIFVFLAYGTTASVSRQAGAGDLLGALRLGVDGVWLGLLLGVVAGAVLSLAAGQVTALFGASLPATEQATEYLQISGIGVPAMLVILAATGVLRGLQDTRTPLVVAIAGFSLNIVLNVWLVYGLDLGIRGSALGTVLAQTSMALALIAVILRALHRQHGKALPTVVRPHPGRVLAAARAGVPLLIRTLALRAVLLLTTWVAASSGDVTLAAYQVSATVWTFLVFALDALAIAAQALTGNALGAADVPRARTLTALMVRWGVWCGVALGAVVVALHGVLPGLFTSDAAVQRALASALLVLALQQPLSGFVFVLDGVLIGAGDGRWLAVASLVQLVLYLPVVLLMQQANVAASGLWWGFGTFMLVRGVLLGWRARTDRWAVIGAAR
ncbi:MATE family efflux transporter [Angustibacter sp. McL0619]|uniref:MATE family efflux transporter n=1 Tax=Angustibacter sp. McL0619 TaxID=3415676 RepID=UPI003CF3F0F2